MYSVVCRVQKYVVYNTTQCRRDIALYFNFLELLALQDAEI